MNITLVTEGTYPHGHGGVSVWCDQLLRGMPEHAFRVVALTATGAEQLAWEPPPHVTVEAVPLWGPLPTGRAPAGKDAHEFTWLCRALFDLILDGGPPQVFSAVLEALHEFAQRESLPVALNGEEPVAGLLGAWSERPLPEGVAPTVYDALTAISLLEHALRPLSRPAVKGDVTHAVSNGMAVLPALVAKWTYGTPLCLTEHGIYLRERYLGYGKGLPWPVKAFILGFFRLLCQTGYQAADLVTPGNRYNHRWETRCGARPEDIRTIYNGVDPAAFPPAGDEPDRLTLSWAGRVDPIKDLETLIRAFAIVHEQLPEVRLRLFGGGDADYRTRCERLAADLDIAEHVVFEGRVPDIRDAYVAGSVVMLSSISEGFPYTLIEAMTCGRPTVSTDVGGVSEAVAAVPERSVGESGLVVPPRDPQAMAWAALRLLRDPELRRRMGEAARRKALEFFTVDQAVTSFRGIYRELARTVTS
ncbi:GT4 family glycosyltransferase PelF [Actinocorallia populi]|uniref:GT4 family glycosyltransferase PelF n=1 Tax=Actinocorallia populi TaxID=2079200 RepID=UPI000D08BA97|nr:GT4 family glycosyltransferase PelF [Actinocorallia populi]